MSVLPDQVPEIPATESAFAQEEPQLFLPVEPPTIAQPPQISEPPHFGQRFAFIVASILIIAVMVAFTPQLAKQIAYAWNIGIEQAKAKAAKQFLQDNPYSEQRIAWVAKAVTPSVVGVRTLESKMPEIPFDARRVRGGLDGFVFGEGTGSGVIIDPLQGYILTNNHVIENAHLIFVRLSDGREVEAKLIGRDSSVDLAVLQIDENDLEAIEWGDSRQVAVGEQVVAIGSPYKLYQTVTSGIISATERLNAPLTVQGIRRGSRLGQNEYLQTDAAINFGNSGGALVDMNGKLIGICTSIISVPNDNGGGGNRGIGFAIPSFTAKCIYDEIVSFGKIRHGWIGVRLEDVTSYDAQLMNQKKPTGAVVERFTGNSPARRARLQVGDVILRWGETEITNSLHLIHLVTLTQPGTTETVEVFRNGEILQRTISVGMRPIEL
jgi:S1-C subfamily serine protease